MTTIDGTVTSKKGSRATGTITAKKMMIFLNSYQITNGVKTFAVNCLTGEITIHWKTGRSWTFTGFPVWGATRKDVIRVNLKPGPAPRLLPVLTMEKAVV